MYNSGRMKYIVPIEGGVAVQEVFRLPGITFRGGVKPIEQLPNKDLANIKSRAAQQRLGKPGTIWDRTYSQVTGILDKRQGLLPNLH